MRLEGVPRELVPHAWNRTQPFIEKLLARGWGENSVETIYFGLADGSAQLWHIVDDDLSLVGVWLTQIYSEPTGIKVCNWLGCAGERMDEWLHLRADIENWAREQGAEAAKIVGRKGWERKLPDYKPAYVEYVKEL